MAGKLYCMIYIFVYIFASVHSDICRGNEYTNGRWVVDKQTEKSFYCCQSDDVGVVAYCGSNKFDTSQSRLFSHEDLLLAPDNACVCDIVADTRYNVSSREEYKWVPEFCEVENFSGDQFCSILGKRRILLIGDSLMHQLSSTLISILKTLNAPCINQISYGKSYYLLHTEKFNVYFDKNQGADICLINTGAGGDIYSVWENIQPWVNQFRATYNTSFVWVTQSYAHLRCQTFQTPVNEFVPIQPEDYGLDKFLWRNFPQYDQMSKDLAKIHNFSLLDISMLQLRPDAHKADKVPGKLDCMHWCFPGPLNIFPSLLYNKLSVGEI